MKSMKTIGVRGFHASDLAYSNPQDVQLITWLHFKDSYKWPVSLDIKGGLVVTFYVNEIIVHLDGFKIHKASGIRHSTMKVKYQSDYSNPNLFDEIHNILINGTLKDCILACPTHH